MINNKFTFSDSFNNKFLKLRNNFKNELAEFVFYRTYSRKDENWAKCILRVISGNMSIRKDYQIKNGLKWNEKYWDKIAKKTAYAIYKQKIMPAGRNLFSSGTDNMYLHGNLQLNNCAFLSPAKDGLIGTACMELILLANGLGLGIDISQPIKKMPIAPKYVRQETFVIPDSKEGWRDSVKLLMESCIYNSGVEYIFDYSKIRPKGSSIGPLPNAASGPGPLKLLHVQIRNYSKRYFNHFDKSNNIDKSEYTLTRLLADIFNSIAICVVSGNSRRSALLLLGSPKDEVFMNLKNYEICPERSNIGYSSNNSVVLNSDQDFMQVPEIVKRIYNNSEPGIINMINIKKYKRYGKKFDNSRICGVNACSEACLEPNELCNLISTYPTNCKDLDEWLEMLELATIFATNNSLLMNDVSPKINEVVARNRKIGVGICGIAELFDTISLTTVVKYLREGYRKIEDINKKIAEIGGTTPSVALTAIAPNGTTGLVAGMTSPGIHGPIYKYYIRRVKVAKNHQTVKHLIKCGVPHSESSDGDDYYFEFPVAANPNVRTSDQISVLEQLERVALLQKWFVDQSISVSIYFDPKADKQKDMENWISLIISRVKTLSFAARFVPNKEYKNLPIEELTEQSYLLRKAAIKWESFATLDTDSSGEKYCNSEKCTL